MEETMTPESNTDQLSTTVSGRLHKFVMPIHEVIKEMYFKYIAEKNITPRYLIISQDIERELFRHFEESLRPDLSIRHSKFMEMEILVRPMGKNKFIDLAA